MRNRALGRVLVLIAFDDPIGTCTVAKLVLVIPALAIGCFLCRHRVAAIA